MKVANTGVISSGAIDEITLNTGSQGSIFLNTGGYLSTPTNTAFTCTSDFTIEGWFFLTSFSSSFKISLGTETTNRYSFVFSGTSLQGTIFGGSTTTFGSSVTTLNDRWYHIALVRSGSTITCYVNGTALVTTQTLSGTVGNGQLFINADSSGTGTNSVTFSNFRFVNGTAVYTSNFNVNSLTPLTAIPNTALLLKTYYNSSDSLIAPNQSYAGDSSTNAFSLTVGLNSFISTPVNPFITRDIDLYNSFYFPGGTDYVAVSSTGATGIGSSDFSIEMWIYPTNLSVATQYIYDQRPTTATAVAPTIYISSSVIYYFVSNANRITGSTLTANTWYHVAVCRVSGSTRMYINGTQVGSTYTDANVYVGGTVNRPLIGTSAGLTSSFNGYISNLRVVIGVAAYPSGSTIAYPSIPYKAGYYSNTTTFTQLLTCQSAVIKDNSPTNLPLTVTGKVISTTNNIPTSVISTANQVISKQYSNGVLQTTGIIDEVSLNDNMIGSIQANTTQYITSPASGNYALGTDDFTIEGWVFLNTATASAGIVGSWTGTASTSAWILQQGAIATNLRFSVSDGTTITSYDGINGLPTTNKWIHIAAVRSSNTLTLYSGGAAVYTGSPGAFTTNIPSASQFIQINGYGGLTNMSSGNFSNFRVTRGQAIYSGVNITVPSSALTAITGTSLLTAQSSSPTVDNSSSSLTITNNGVTATNAVIPFTSTYSDLFNGTSSYLAIPTSSFLPVINNTYTVEFWMYPTAYPTASNQTCMYQLASPNAGSFGSFNFEFLNTGQIRLEVRPSTGGVNVAVTSPAILPLNKWTHVAVSCYVGNVIILINGVSTVSGTVVAMDGTQTFCSIGYLTNGYTTFQSYYSGYISNFRIVKGVALYNGPPVTPLTAITNTKLLTAQSAAITDSSGTVTITNAGTVTSTASTIPFSSTYSYSFNGTSQYMTAPYTISNFDWWGVDYTIEAWIYTTTNTGWWNLAGGIQVPNLIQNGDFNTTTCYWGFGINGSNQVAFYYFSGAGNIVTSTTTITLSAWNHIAVTKTASGITLYVNGIAQTTTAISGTPQSSTANPLTIGAGNSTYINGYVSNLRIVKGTAVYTSRTQNFTPPAKRLQLIQGANTNIAAITDKTKVKFLLNSYKFGYEDGSVYNNTITSVGTPVASPQSPYYQPAAGYYSVGFNNSVSSSLSIPYNAGFGIPAGQAFSIELWTYMTASTLGVVFCGWNYTYGTSSTWSLQIDPAAMFPQLTIAGTGQGGSLYYFSRSSSYTIPLNQWTHIVITRDSTGAGRVFINGIMSAYYFTALTTGSGQALTAASGAMYFGQAVNGLAPAFPGLMSNFRFVNGNVPAAYATSSTTIGTAVFTPPTSPPSSEANTKFLVCQSSSFIDTSSIGGAVTVAGTPTISTLTPYTTQISSESYYSYVFNGTSQYVLTPSPANSAFTFNADFTVEGWFYFTSISASQADLFHVGSETTNRMVWYTISGVIYGNFFAGVQHTYGGSLVANTWYHIAFARVGSTITCYVNGTSVGTRGQAGNVGNGPFSIAATPTATQFLPAFISNVRIVKGIALYTGNFTPSTVPLIATSAVASNGSTVDITSNTSLLTCQSSTLIDKSSNIFTLTNGGGTGASTWSPFVNPNTITPLSAPSPTITTNTTMRKQFSNGTIQAIGSFDETLI